MPAKKSARSPGMAPLEKAKVVAPLPPLEDELELRPLRSLVMGERMRLQQIFDDLVFRQAWRNAQHGKPPLFPMGLGAEHGAQVGNNRLHQLQGWEMFKVALLRQTQEPKQPTPRLDYNFPDAGTIEADAKSKIKTT